MNRVNEVGVPLPQDLPFGREAEPRGHSIDADEALSVGDLGDGRERRRLVKAAETARAVRHETRQPEGEKSPDRQNSLPSLS